MTARLLILLLALGAADGVVLAAVQDQDVDERKAAQVKAAFVYNFAKFVDWPAAAFDDAEEDTPAPLVIGVVGDAYSRYAVAEAVKGKDLRGRAIEVRSIALEEDEPLPRETLAACHVLYLNGSIGRRLDPVLDYLDGEPVLTVSDVKRFAERGGMIGLVLRDGRYRFHINEGEAKRAGLRMSPKLLSLATIVSTEDEDE